MNYKNKAMITEPNKAATTHDCGECKWGIDGTCCREHCDFVNVEDEEKEVQ